MSNDSWTTYQNPDAIHEDLEDIVYMVDPTETPWMTKISTGRAEDALHLWNIRDLAAPDGNNAAVEGADMNDPQQNQATRLGGYTQLFDKEIKVSTSIRASNTAGYEDELSEQLDDKIKEIKRDIETRITGNFAGVAGDQNTARETPGLQAWIASNYKPGATGSAGGLTSPGAVSAATPGTPRPLTEDLYYDVAQDVWQASAEFDCILVGAYQKRVMSSWASYGTVLTAGDGSVANSRNVNQDAGAKRLINSIMYIEDDFGIHEILMDRFCPTDYLAALNSEYWCLDYLIPFNEFELARLGHADRRGMSAELCNTSRNEKASGLLADLSTP